MGTEYSKYDTQQLTPEEIRRGEHRQFVGGMWEEIGKLQFDFLVGKGLLPTHRLLDVGCGSLRGGLHFINYLDAGNYFGIDTNASVIDAAWHELAQAALVDQAPVLIVDDRFSFERFGTTFDYLLSISVFTHLPHNSIVRALKKAKSVMAPGGSYYATYFDAPSPACLDDITQRPGGIVTHYDRNPFHYAGKELALMAEIAGLDVEIIGDWGHPRGQQMARFY